MRLTKAFCASFIFLLLISFESPLCLGDGEVPKGVIILDQSVIDVDFNISNPNYVIFSGNVYLNQSESGFVNLSADAGGWEVLITPQSFFVDTNTSSQDFSLVVLIPQNTTSSGLRIVNVSGVIRMTDNVTEYQMDSVSAVINVKPTYRASIEFSFPLVEIPPGASVVLRVRINNLGSEGIFLVNIANLMTLTDMGWGASLSTSKLKLLSGESNFVNVSIELPGDDVIWIDRTYMIKMNVTTENGEELDSGYTNLRVRGTYIDPMVVGLCGSVLIIILIISMVGYSKMDKDLVSEMKQRKREHKIQRKLEIMVKRGIISEEEFQSIKEEMRKKKEERIKEREKEEGESKEERPFNRLPACPVCSSTDVKSHALGNYKCQSCGHFFGK